MWIDSNGHFMTTTGTSDLAWCARVQEQDFLTKAGWGDFAKKHPKYPFLIDTNIFCQQIDPQGVQYPKDVNLPLDKEIGEDEPKEEHGVKESLSFQ